MGSGLLNTRAACVTAGGCSGWGTGAGSLGLVCGAGDCCTGGFSSTTSGTGVVCASSEALVRLLRCTGCAFGSLGSACLRDFLGFFSGSCAFASLGLGFGPGFLRGCPDAVRPRGAGDVAFAGVGVLAPPTPTPPAETRIVELGVPCSGECGGLLRLPGDDASFASMAENTKDTKSPTRYSDARWAPYTTGARLVYTSKKCRMQSGRSRRQRTRRVCGRLLAERVLQTQHHKASIPTNATAWRTPKSARSRLPGPRVTWRESDAPTGTPRFAPNKRSMAATTASAVLMIRQLRWREFVQKRKRRREERAQEVDVFRRGQSV